MNRILDLASKAVATIIGLILGVATLVFLVGGIGWWMLTDPVECIIVSLSASAIVAIWIGFTKK